MKEESIMTASEQNALYRREYLRRKRIENRELLDGESVRTLRALALCLWGTGVAYHTAGRKNHA